MQLENCWRQYASAGGMSIIWYFLNYEVHSTFVILFKLFLVTYHRFLWILHSFVDGIVNAMIRSQCLCNPLLEYKVIAFGYLLDIDYKCFRFPEVLSFSFLECIFVCWSKAKGYKLLGDKLDLMAAPIVLISVELTFRSLPWVWSGVFASTILIGIFGAETVDWFFLTNLWLTTFVAVIDLKNIVINPGNFRIPIIFLLVVTCEFYEVLLKGIHYCKEMDSTDKHYLNNSWIVYTSTTNDGNAWFVQSYQLTLKKIQKIWYKH